MIFTFTSFVALGARHLRLLDYLEGSWLRASPYIPLGNDLPSSLTLFDSSSTCTGVTHSQIKLKLRFWSTKLTKKGCGTNVIWPEKPVQNSISPWSSKLFYVYHTSEWSWNERSQRHIAIRFPQNPTYSKDKFIDSWMTISPSGQGCAFPSNADVLITCVSATTLSIIRI